MSVDSRLTPQLQSIADDGNYYKYYGYLGDS